MDEPAGSRAPTDGPVPPGGRLLGVLMLWSVALAARFLVGVHIVDDAYITMRYSRHLAALHVISYNPPDPVLGTSTPLWMWLLAAAASAGMSLPRAAVSLSALADLTTIAVLVGRRQVDTRSWYAALGAATAIAAWPAYLTYAVSGMETSPYVCLLVASFVALTSGREALAGVVAGAAFLCRPDGATAVLVTAAAALRRGRFRAFLAGVVPAVIPWVLYAWWRFGSPIPSSVVAKASLHTSWLLSASNLRSYFFHGPYVLVTPLALAGCVLLLKERHEHWRLWVAWCLLYMLGMVAAGGFTHYPWYYAPLLPLYVGAAAAASLAASERLLANRTSRFVWVRAVLGAALVAAVLLARTPSLRKYLTALQSQREALYLEIGSKLAAEAPGCTVAATEIGALGYAYPDRILDLAGLTSPQVIGRDLTSVLAESGAAWLVTYDSHFDRAEASRPEFRRLFIRRIVRPVSPERSLEVYERTAGAACASVNPGVPARS